LDSENQKSVTLDESRTYEVPFWGQWIDRMQTRLNRRISTVSTVKLCLLKRISVTVQRFSSVLLHNSLYIKYPDSGPTIIAVLLC